MVCKKGLQIKVCSSPSGYYLGTVDLEGLPNCRCSVQYYDSFSKAQDALHTGFLIRTAPENRFCADGNCF